MSKEHFEELLEETGRKVEGFATETKAAVADVSKRLDRIEAKQNMQTPGDGGRVEVKSLEKLLNESKGYKQFKEQKEVQRGQNIKLLEGLSVKNTVTSLQGESGSPSLGYPVQADRYGQIVGRPLRPFRLLDFVAVEPCDSNAQELVKNSAETDNVAIQASEGTTKSESTYGFSLRSVPIKTIAHWVKVSTQVAADAPLLVRFLETVMLHRARRKLENLIINGETANNVQGLLEVAPTVQTAGPLAMDRIGEAEVSVTLADYVADAVIVHPRPWDAMRRAKDANGNYMIGSFQNDPTPRLWGLPVIVSPAISESRILVGAFSQFAVLEREGFRAELGRSGDDFTANLNTLLVEGRYGIRINDPNAFAQIVIGGSPGG